MKNPDNIAAAAKLKIDMMGFIFYPKSPRFVDNYIPETPRNIQRTGVFVNAYGSTIYETAKKYNLTHIQLHGYESPEFCRKIRQPGFKVIKAISVLSPEDIDMASEYEGTVDYLLFDTKCHVYGGSGEKFNWSLLSMYNGRTPFLLSGGIGINDAEEICAFKHPRFAGIDLNSGFEISPGYKDIQKLSRFTDIINNNQNYIQNEQNRYSFQS